MKKTIWLLSLLLLTGCGGDKSDSKKSTPTQIPTKVTIALPDSNKFLVIQDFQTMTVMFSIVYSTLLPEIAEKCKDYAINEICEIPENSISLVLTDEVFKRVEEHNISSDFLLEYYDAPEAPSPLGKITFAQQDNNHLFQYRLTIVPMNTQEGITHFQWSSDNNSFFTSTVPNGEEIGVKYSLFYQKDSNDKEEVYLTNEIISSTEDIDDNSHYYIDYHIEEKLESNNSLSIKTNFINEIPLSNEFLIRKAFQHTKYTDEGEVEALNYTEHLSSGAEEFYNKLIMHFDTYGELLSQESCSNISTECQLEDINNSLVEFNIGDSNLSDGKYFLLPKDYEVSNITLDELLDKQVGEFVIFRHSKNGILHNEYYRDDLNKLQIVHVTFMYEEKSTPYFQVISPENRPLLELKL